MPVITAVELHDPVPAGEPACDPDRAHRGLGARGNEPDLFAPGDPRADRLGEQHLAGVGVPKVVPLLRRFDIASVTAGCAWPSNTAP